MSNVQEDKRRGELYEITTRFRNKPVTAESLNAYCQLNGYEPIDLGQLKDFIFQMEHDEKMVALVAEIIGALKDLKVVPVLVTEEESKKMEDENEALRIRIAKIIEKHGISQIMLENLGGTLKEIIGGIPDVASRTISNNSLTVMRTITQQALNLPDMNAFTSKHVGEYMDNFNKQYEDKNKDGGDEGTETAEPESSN